MKARKYSLALTDDDRTVRGRPRTYPNRKH